MAKRGVCAECGYQFGLRPDGEYVDDACPACERAESLLFLDSHGGLWRTCWPDHEDAVAFGPRGTARQIAIEGCGHGPTLEARGIGRVIDPPEDGEWYTFALVERQPVPTLPPGGGVIVGS